MPNTEQAKKRVRQNEKARNANRTQLSALRSQFKKFRAAIDARNIEVAERELRICTKMLDKSSGTNTIHKNAASRHKSRLSKHLNAAKAALKA